MHELFMRALIIQAKSTARTTTEVVSLLTLSSTYDPFKISGQHHLGMQVTVQPLV